MAVHSTTISESNSIERAREGFELLSFSIRKILEQFGNPLDLPLKLAHCPMAAGSEGASWVQQDEEITNSYFGASMYRCGEFLEVVSPSSYLKSSSSTKR